MRALGIVVVALALIGLQAAQAGAQPQEHDDERPPNEPVAPPPAPARSAAPGASAGPGAPQVAATPAVETTEAADCARERLLILQTAASTKDEQLRDRLLGIVPDCRPTPVASVRATRTLEPAPSAVARPRRGGLFEIGAGFGTAFVTNGGRGTTELAIGTGVGAFLTRDIALELRAAGQLFFDNATGFSGFIGPTLQGWLSPQAFLGGGVGLGLSAASCDGCQTFTSVGFDLRLGYAFNTSGRGAHVSFEATHHTVDLNQDPAFGGQSFGITTFLVQLGYAMF